MNKIAWYLTLALILTMAAPLALSDANDCFDGWFTGLSVGGTFRKGHGNSNTTINILDDDDATAVFHASQQFNADQNSPLGVISGGYGCTWCDVYYGGIEGFLSVSEYHQTSPIDINTITIVGGGGATVARTNYSNSIETKLNALEFGLDLRPGYLLCPNTLLFARIGIAYNKLSITRNINQGFLSPGDADGGFSFVSSKSNKKRAALRLGLGLERQLYDSWSLRADYIFTYYGKISAASNTQTAGSIPGRTFVSNANDAKRFTLYGNAVMLGLFYYW